MLTFIDDFSRYAVIYLIKEKSEVFGKFCEYVEMCKTMFHKKPRGGEYTGNEFVKFMNNQGIQYQRTAPYNQPTAKWGRGA